MGFSLFSPNLGNEKEKIKYVVFKYHHHYIIHLQFSYYREKREKS